MNVNFSPLWRAVFVFLFMLFVATQVSTGFVYALMGGHRPWALGVLDRAFGSTLIAHIGQSGAFLLLLALGLLMAWLAYRRKA